MTKLTNADPHVNSVVRGSPDSAPQKFVRLNDLRRDGYLPWGRSRIYDLSRQGVLPEPMRFGARLTGYTLGQISDIQSKLMTTPRAES
jgi:predicted DNA-binding transcriptional regulator AlpA